MTLEDINQILDSDLLRAWDNNNPICINGWPIVGRVYHPNYDGWLVDILFENENGYDILPRVQIRNIVEITN